MNLGEQAKELGAMLAIGATLFALIQGLFFWAYRWLLDQHEKRITARIAAFEVGEQAQTSLIRSLEREMLVLRAELPREYVSRADWIRFGASIDAKLDALRESVDELAHERTKR